MTSPDCEPVLGEGGRLIGFIVKDHLARDVDEPNPVSSLADAEALAKRFRAILGRGTRAEQCTEKEDTYVTEAKKGKWEGKWHVMIQGRGYGTGRVVLHPETKDEWFDTQQEGIDLKKAWHKAEDPEDWLKPKKPKKRKHY